MFCEKCGNPMNDNDKFCQKCGAPVHPVQAQPAPEQGQPAPEPAPQPMDMPNPTEPAVPVQPVTEQPMPSAPVQPMTEQPMPSAPVQPAAPKKGLPKAAKLAIIFGSAGVALVIILLILLFTVILPMFRPTIDLTQYVTLEIYDNYGKVVDGMIDGEVEIDADAITTEYPELFGNNYEARSALDGALYEMKLTCVDSKRPDDFADGYRYAGIYSLSKDSVLTVTVNEPDDEYSKKSLSEYVKRLGANLKGGTVKLSIADIIEENDYTIRESVDMDLLGYIKENKLITTGLDDNGKPAPTVKTFEAKFGDFTVKNEYLYSSYVEVYESDDYCTSIYLDFDKTTGVKAGDKVTLSYSEDNYVESYGIVLTGDPVSYTVAAPETLTAASGKKNVKALQAYLTAHPELDDNYTEGNKVEIGDIYYVEWVNTKGMENLIYVVKDGTKNEFYTVDISAKGFFADGEFIYEGYSGYAHNRYKTADEAVKANSALDAKSKIYKATKLN